MQMIICSCCGENKKPDDYYSSKSFLMRAHGRVHTCKKCLWEYVIPDNKVDYDMKKVYEVLRGIDKPFVSSLWLSSFEEAESKGFKSDVFKLYMRNIAMKDFRDLGWDSSELDETVPEFNNTSNSEDEILEISNKKGLAIASPRPLNTIHQ